VFFFLLGKRKKNQKRKRVPADYFRRWFFGGRRMFSSLFSGKEKEPKRKPLAGHNAARGFLCPDALRGQGSDGIERRGDRS
jgi:hypothetical protein